jgi:hypothetical protein
LVRYLQLWPGRSTCQGSSNRWVASAPGLSFSPLPFLLASLHREKMLEVFLPHPMLSCTCGMPERSGVTRSHIGISTPVEVPFLYTLFRMDLGRQTVCMGRTWDCQIAPAVYKEFLEFCTDSCLSCLHTSYVTHALK